MDIEQALSTAIGYEHKVRDHYVKAKDLVLDPKGKKLFETLAREEQGHVDYLESRLAEWHKRGKLNGAKVTTELPVVDWIAKAKEQVAKSPSKDLAVQAELDLLKTALELERQTSGFYRELVNTLKADDQALFARFLEIEQGHLAIVQAEIDSLTGNGHWFDMMEFSLEAGG